MNRLRVFINNNHIMGVKRRELHGPNAQNKTRHLITDTLNRSECFLDLTRVFLSSNIPLHKLKNSTLCIFGRIYK